MYLIILDGFYCSLDEDSFMRGKVGEQDLAQFSWKQWNRLVRSGEIEKKIVPSKRWEEEEKVVT